MIYLTNAYREHAIEYVEDPNLLPTLHVIGPDEKLVIGDPKETEKNSVRGLKILGVVGIYKVKE